MKIGAGRWKRALTVAPRPVFKNIFSRRNPVDSILAPSAGFARNLFVDTHRSHTTTVEKGSVAFRRSPLLLNRIEPAFLVVKSLVDVVRLVTRRTMKKGVISSFGRKPAKNAVGQGTQRQHGPEA